jgi:stage II sporulation protein D
MLKNNIIIISLFLLFASWHYKDLRIKIKPLEDKNSIHFSTKYSVDEIVNIRIFSQIKVQSFTFSADAGTYSVWANGLEVVNTSQSPLIKLTYVNDSVEVKTFENVIGKYKRIKISSPDFVKSFRMKLISPDRKPRFYQDNLYVTTESGDLKCINSISLDNYIAGVVQAESGRRSFQEFYKVQAILARTFALSH